MYYNIQWEGKAFRLLYIFCHLLKLKKLILFLINVHSAPHLDGKNQKCRNVCKFMKKENSWSTLLSSYSREPSCEWCNTLFTPGVGAPRPSFMQILSSPVRSSVKTSPWVSVYISRDDDRWRRPHCIFKCRRLRLRCLSISRDVQTGCSTSSVLHVGMISKTFPSWS